MMRHITTRTYIALGLSFVLLSVLLFALMLGLLPDEQRARRAGRADLGRLRSTLRLALDRNPDLLSAAVWRCDGEVVVAVGSHVRPWHDNIRESSSQSDVKVPVWQGG